MSQSPSSLSAANEEKRPARRRRQKVHGLRPLSRRLSRRHDAAVHTSRHAHAADRAHLEVGLGLHSDSNFYVGFESIQTRCGLFVATLRALPVGARVTLDVHLPFGQSFVAEGRVSWVREGGDDDGAPGLGVALGPLDESAVRLAERFARNRDPLFYPDMDDGC